MEARHANSDRYSNSVTFNRRTFLDDENCPTVTSEEQVGSKYFVSQLITWVCLIVDLPGQTLPILINQTQNDS